MTSSQRSPEKVQNGLTRSDRPRKPLFRPQQPAGYTLLLLLIAVFIMGLGLLVAVPVLETQLRREKEEELIFRGRQYQEAIRLYQQKKPGTYPASLEELVKEKCLRKIYPDPMSENGRWHLLLLPSAAEAGRGSVRAGETRAADKLLVVPEENLKKIRNPQIVGVVSSSRQKSIKVYQEEEYYNKWLFYYGQTEGKKPQLIYQTGD
ncbi:MAG: type II secretion system GspH family protein [Candidatus Saccharicenans sp.]|jgi:type II secretory pathway pseudopilin PulG|nr:type II secretion system GspH family protein [Candidatus Saccharicenans sp.]MDH7493426.1 type II secretion system protein [Candidatus Saccharicenans sp.]